MSIGRPMSCAVVLCLIWAGRVAAQDKEVQLTEAQQPLVISGFAVGLGSYDRNLAQTNALGSKIAISLFKPWSDPLYLFGQRTPPSPRECSMDQSRTRRTARNGRC